MSYYIFIKGMRCMGRMSYLDYQLHMRMEGLKMIGQSRHKAKIEYKQICNENKYRNKSMGIHSYNTYSAYKQTSIEFIKYIKENHNEIKDVTKIKRTHIKEYIKHREKQGMSIYTISKDMAALNKLFNTDITKKEVGIGCRSYTNINRSRISKPHDKKYNPKNYKEQITFAKATGCRRESILKVKKEDIILNNDGIPIKVCLKEKGGRERHATILKQYREVIKDIIDSREYNKALFQKYTKKIDNHAFRGEYAKHRYRELVETKGYDSMDFRGYDAFCLNELTQDLGHNRLDVVVYHYLK